MKDWMERFAMLPFSIGCASQSSVDVVVVDTSQPAAAAAAAAEAKKPKSSSSSSETKPPLAKEERDQEILPKERTKNSISGGIHKLVRSIRSLVQVFVYKDEDEEREGEMEIGYPTDVKHVTHIGLDGTTTTNPVKGWENLKAPEIVSFPAISLKQFELAMAVQAHQQSDDLLVDPNSKLGLKK